MNAKRKIIGGLGFATHCILTIPIILCDVVRTIVGYACVDDIRNEFNSVFELLRSSYSGLGYTMDLVYKRYMGDD